MSWRICDIECYQNYFLALALDRETGTVYRWERYDDLEFGRTHDELRSMLKEHTAATFNGLGYDLWMIAAYLDGYTNKELKSLSDYLITTENAVWTVTGEKSIEIYDTEHVDLMPVAPLIASLKIYAGRLHAPKLQDLPIAPDAVIDNEQRDELIEYCINDLHATNILLEHLMPQIELRREMSVKYGMSLESRSDAQIAEAVIKSLLAKHNVKARRPSDVAKVFRYETPGCVELKTSIMRSALAIAETAEYKLGASGSLLCPPLLRRPFEFKGRKYKMGIGGLHSQEKAQFIEIEGDEYLTDLDVTSYYPRLILNNRLFPQHLGENFLSVYESLVNDRVAAKMSGDTVTADALKIVINSSFGKFGSKYSSLYSPKLLLQTTISGQLYLLMLIEMIERETVCEVVSANTDGITVHSPHGMAYEKMISVSKEWEKRTAMSLENVEYRALYAQDVNNYLAIKRDGGHKGKGLFAGQSLSKNPQFPIIAHAVTEHFMHGTMIEQTMEECRDIRQFVALRKVTGGALYRDEISGSTVRWYLSKKGGPILYNKNLNRVPQAEFARLINELPDEFPDDLDVEAYSIKAHDLVRSITNNYHHA